MNNPLIVMIIKKKVKVKSINQGINKEIKDRIMKRKKKRMNIKKEKNQNLILQA